MKYYCNKCRKPITSAEYNYSKKNCGKPLCREHQPNNQKSDKNPLKTLTKSIFSNKNPPKRKFQKKNPEPTKEATDLYNELIKLGVRAELEKFDGFKHIDIAIVKAKVNIEIDGGHHNYSHKQALRDLKRTFHSFKKGYVTLRVPNSLIKNHLKETAEYIAEFISESLAQLEDEDLDFW